MNECTQPYNGDPAVVSRSPPLSVDGIAIEGSTETMHKVAEVSRSLKSVVSVIETLVQTTSGGGDLTLTHCLILVNLSRSHTCKQSDLHTETGITPGYLTRLIDTLVAKSMVRRRRSTRDRRQILLSLTDHGKDVTLSLLAAIDQHRLLGALDNLKSSLDRFMAVSAPRGTHAPRNTRSG
jgi:DNA-binding MarR family transcriptional regulator